jgi:hypothetical protein
MATPLASNFSLITAGSFQMGDNLDSMYDAPAHIVSVGSFTIAKTELNYGDWKAVKSWAENHGYQFNNAGSGRGNNYPVTNINWYDAVKWCNARSEMEGLTPFYYLDASFNNSTVYRSGQVDISGSTINRSATGYRLPTEAEWEKAARGGLVGKRYPNGDTLANNDANFDNHSDGTTPSKFYPANGFGLYDMTGNSWEWVGDWYADTYDLSTTWSPQGPDSGGNKVARGGGWNRSFHFDGQYPAPYQFYVPLKSYIRYARLEFWGYEVYPGSGYYSGGYLIESSSYIYDTRTSHPQYAPDWLQGSSDYSEYAHYGLVDFGPDLSSLTVAGRSCFSPGYSDMNSGVRLVRSALPAGFPSVGLPVVTGTALTVNARGATPLSYQWFYNGTPIESGSSATLPTTGLSGGTYSVRVSNSVGTSTSAALSVADYIFPSQYLLLIPAGTFAMGNNGTGDGAEHTVNVSAFSICKTDVIYAEWNMVKAWAEVHGYQFDRGGEGIGDRPVTNVSWYDAVKWSNAKSEMQGLTAVYYTSSSFSSGAVYKTGQVNVTNAMVNWNANGFRLPTEAEWEKAARGGLIGKLYPNGDGLTSNDANFGSKVGDTTPVKNYAPNGCGLYDMAGNVWQWCWDWYGNYDGVNEIDPQGPNAGVYRVLRGGSWYDSAGNCRVSYRDNRPSNGVDGRRPITGWDNGLIFGPSNYGFRLVRRDPSLGTPL